DFPCDRNARHGLLNHGGKTNYSWLLLHEFCRCPRNKLGYFGDALLDVLVCWRSKPDKLSQFGGSFGVFCKQVENALHGIGPFGKGSAEEDRFPDQGA